MKNAKLRSYLLLLLVPMLLIGLVGLVSAKYIKTYESGTYTVTFSNDLADKFLLQEHIPTRQADGMYVIPDDAANITTTGQEYKILPGLDIDKDPHVVIEGKSEVPAYLYIEIVEDFPSAAVSGSPEKLIRYETTDQWMETTAISPKQGGKVYVYVGNGTEPVVLDESTSDLTIYILENDQVVVSQYVKSYGLVTSELMTIYAYLEEKTS